MIYFWTISSLLVSLKLWLKLSRIQDKKSIPYVSVSAALEFFLTIFVVGAIYSGLQLWIDSDRFAVSDLTTIHEMEAMIVQLRGRLLPILDINVWVKFGIIALLVFLGWCVPKFGRMRLVARAQSGFKWLRRGYIFATVLASVTFFGSAVSGRDERIAEIKAKIDEVTAGNQTYETKVDRIARRIIVESVMKTKVYETPVTKFDEYISARNRAIDHARERPLNEEITFPLDADEFDRRYRGEFEEFTEKVKTECKALRPKPTPESTIDVANGTAKQQKDLNNEADSVLASTDEKDDGLIAAVEETATLVHEQTSKPLIERVVTTLSGAAGENELFKLLYEPFLQTPVEELTKRLAVKLFETTKYGRKTLKDAVLAASENSDAQIGSLEATDVGRMSRAGESLGLATEQMHIFEKNAEIEIAKKSLAESARRLTELSAKWKQAYAYSGSAILQKASDADLVIVEERVRAVKTPLARLKTETEFQQALFSPRPSMSRLLAFEAQTLKTRNMRDSVRAVTTPVLAIDEAGKWGPIRKSILTSKVNTDDRETIASVEKIINRIAMWRTQQALDFVLSGNSAAVDQLTWERQFYKLTQEDGEIAALWGWVVKGLYESEVEGRYGRAIPQFGYQYYVTETGLGTEHDVVRVFHESETVSFIEKTCNRLGN